MRLSHLRDRSEEHTSELQSLTNLVCRLLLEKKKNRSRSQSLSVHNSRGRRGHRRRAARRLLLSRSQPLRFHALRVRLVLRRLVFFFNDTATTEIYTLSLHDALPI